MFRIERISVDRLENEIFGKIADENGTTYPFRYDLDTASFRDTPTRLPEYLEDNLAEIIVGLVVECVAASAAFEHEAMRPTFGPHFLIW